MKKRMIPGTTVFTLLLILLSAACSPDPLLDKIGADISALLDTSRSSEGEFTLESSNSTVPLSSELVYNPAGNYGGSALYTLQSTNGHEFLRNFRVSAAECLQQITPEDFVSPVPAGFSPTQLLPSLPVFTAPLLEGHTGEFSASPSLTNFPCPVTGTPLDVYAVIQSGFTVTGSGFSLTLNGRNYENCVRIETQLQLTIYNSNYTPRWEAGALILQKKEQLELIFSEGKPVSCRISRQLYNASDGTTATNSSSAARSPD